MTNEKIVVLQVRFTRTRALMALALFFLCWHPKPLGSETLQLTTYYPAPYGGYVSILTTGNTVLARDNGVANSYVRLGTGYNGGNGRRDNNVKLEVGDGDISTMANVKWGTAGGRLSTDQGGSIELGGHPSGVGTPYLDFIRTPGEDFSARLWLPGANHLQVVGDFSLTRNFNGWIQGLCSEVPYGGGTSLCPIDPATGQRLRVIMQYGTSNCVSAGQLFLGGALESPARWTPHVEQGCAGRMLCCRIRNF